MTIQHFLRTFCRSALVMPLIFPVLSTAQQEQQAHRADRFPHYVIQDLETLGGPYSFSYNLNNAGEVSGGSATAKQNGNPAEFTVNAPQTAFLWRHGHLLNLGTLGGPDSAGAAANLFGLAAIDSETTSLSRQGEDVCAFGTNLQCLAATWKDGRLRPLPLLSGGNNSYAMDMNDRGQIVGFADTDVYDFDCTAPIAGAPFRSTAGFRFQTVIWEPDGSVRPLAPLDADTGVGFATGINNHGQVVGVSGTCANTTPPPYVTASHAVLWRRDGTPIDLGSLGGGSGATAINERGDISGTSTDTDGLPQSFLWTPETRKLVQLVTPAGFVAAVNPCCNTINDEREIVGFMFNADFSVQHAFLWKNGVMVDLNDLIPKDSPWTLQGAFGINDSGQIAGQGLINGEVHAFLATPCHQHEGRECCEKHDQ